MHGFDELYGILYHLNAMEEPCDPEYPEATGFIADAGPGREHCSIPRQLTWMTRPSSHGGAGSVSSPSPTPVHCRRTPVWTVFFRGVRAGSSIDHAVTVQAQNQIKRTDGVELGYWAGGRRVEVEELAQVARGR
jgi:hypothetical protein